MVPRDEPVAVARLDEQRGPEGDGPGTGPASRDRQESRADGEGGDGGTAQEMAGARPAARRQGRGQGIDVRGRKNPLEDLEARLRGASPRPEAP